MTQFILMQFSSPNLLTFLLTFGILAFSGCLATACALSYGLYSFRKGDKKMSQMMMRTRIAAQGFTVVALVIGVGMTMGKS